MRSMAVTLWLISVVLVVSVEDQIQVRGLTYLQNKGANLVLEDLHSKENTKRAYKIQSISQNTEQDYFGEKFVQLQFLVKQTNCKKENWKDVKCRTLRNGRTEDCFACFVFQSNSNMVLSQHISCLHHPSVNLEQDTARRLACQDIEPTHLPGSISFGRFYEPTALELPANLPDY
ncbi:retinoic acid receptor responder protein 2-like [Discoglossus pictus]